MASGLRSPRIANAGIAGEVSQKDLDRSGNICACSLPNARYFVVGYGTNDLGMWPDVEETSPRIIGILDGMVRAIRDGGRQPILLNDYQWLLVRLTIRALAISKLCSRLNPRRDKWIGNDCRFPCSGDLGCPFWSFCSLQQGLISLTAKNV
jgi:hypothetical protein